MKRTKVSSLIKLSVFYIQNGWKVLNHKCGIIYKMKVHSEHKKRSPSAMLDGFSQRQESRRLDENALYDKSIFYTKLFKLL